MKRAAWLLLTVALLSACFTNETATIQTLDKSGFTDIKTTRWDFGCGDNDAYSTGFVATNPIGKRVSGVVCCGMWTKACTVRF